VGLWLSFASASRWEYYISNLTQKINEWTNETNEWRKQRKKEENNGWMKERNKERTNERNNERANETTNERTAYKRANETSKRNNERTNNERTKETTNQRTNEWTNERTKKQIQLNNKTKTWATKQRQCKNAHWDLKSDDKMKNYDENLRNKWTWNQVVRLDSQTGLLIESTHCS